MSLPILSGIQVDEVVFSDQLSEIVLEVVVVYLLNHEFVLVLQQSQVVTFVFESGCLELNVGCARLFQILPIIMRFVCTEVVHLTDCVELCVRVDFELSDIFNKISQRVCVGRENVFLHGSVVARCVSFAFTSSSAFVIVDPELFKQ